MQMTKEEILREYRLMKDKMGAPKVLAELNAVPVKEIRAILAELGEKVPTDPRSRSAGRKPGSKAAKQEPEDAPPEDTGQDGAGEEQPETGGEKRKPDALKFVQYIMKNLPEGTGKDGKRLAVELAMEVVRQEMENRLNNTKGESGT